MLHNPGLVSAVHQHESATDIHMSPGFPGGSDGKDCLQCRRPRANAQVRKIPWRRGWQPTPVFLPGESPWTEEPGKLQSIRLQRVRRD